MNNFFIDYLDNFERTDETNRKVTDYYALNSHILSNYYYHNFYQDHLDHMNSGSTFSIQSPSNLYYDYYSQPVGHRQQIENTSSMKSNYDMWKSSNEFRFDLSNSELNLLCNPPLPSPEKTNVQIDTNINSIDDLIKIIDTYELQESVEYNIDLKSLHNIRTELVKLNSMVGMVELKKTILYQLLYFIQKLHEGQNTSDFKHTVIYGPPGTGKTEIAEIIGTLYSKLGILAKNSFKKVTRSDLIAGYLGQTAIKTKGVIDESLGGVLFIDEAYSLAPDSSDNNDSYSKECLDTLCESLSDHKHDLMVIIAGYEDELDNTFFRVNKGLESRFIWRFNTDAYTNEELHQIFRKKVLEQEWTLGIDTFDMNKWFDERLDCYPHYGRDMELLLMYTKIAHGRRIYGKPKEEFKIITIDDMNEGQELFSSNKKKQKKQVISVALQGMYV
jgi:hypothetical protein